MPVSVLYAVIMKLIAALVNQVWFCATLNFDGWVARAEIVR
jgi:hypothetical protein